MPRIPNCLVTVLAGAWLAWPAGAAEPKPVLGSDPNLPKLDFDGQVSVNDRCPVRKHKLNPQIAPLWVNGKPLAFC